MPEPLPVWHAVAAAMGHGHKDSAPSKWPGATKVWKNYAVPEPGMVANMPDVQRYTAVTNWCRFRAVVGYRIAESLDGLNTTAWRAIVSLGSPGPAGAVATSDTATGRKRAEALAILSKSIQDFGVEVRLVLHGCLVDSESMLGRLRYSRAESRGPLARRSVGYCG